MTFVGIAGLPLRQQRGACTIRRARVGMEEAKMASKRGGQVPANFRDAASAFDGIRPGLLFRSSLPTTAEHLEYLQDFNYIDLRSGSERTNLFDAREFMKEENSITSLPLPSGGLVDSSSKNANIWWEATLFEEKDAIVAAISSIGYSTILPLAFAYPFARTWVRERGGALFQQQGYEHFLQVLFKASRFRTAAVMRAITAQTNLPSVTFCSAGKDRTGIIWALLLVCLGASYHQAATDYALSCPQLKKDDPEYFDYLADKLARIGMNPAEFMLSPYDVMINLLNGIEQTHGSVASYLEAIGIAADEQRDLVQRFTIPKIESKFTS